MTKTYVILDGLDIKIGLGMSLLELESGLKGSEYTLSREVTLQQKSPTDYDKYEGFKPVVYPNNTYSIYALYFGGEVLFKVSVEDSTLGIIAIDFSKYH